MKIAGHLFTLHGPGPALGYLRIGRAICVLMHHVYRLRSMILQADLLARLELTLLHQLLEVLAPQSSLALVGGL
ncbi:hypothetical protein D9M73_230550 [compost metagenome]